MNLLSLLSRLFRAHKLIAFLSIAIVLFNCANEPVAGGAGSETNSGITAQLIDENGQIVANAAFKIRPSWYVRVDSQNSAYENLALAYYGDTQSDNQGKVLLPKVSAGQYIIDIQSPSQGKLLPLNVSKNDSLYELGKIYLSPLTTLKGTVKNPQKIPMLLQIYGTERIFWTDSLGNFNLPKIPAGSKIIRVSKSFNQQLLGEFRVEESSQTDTIIQLDTIQIEEAVFDTSLWSNSSTLYASEALRDSSFEATPLWSNMQMPLLFPINHTHIDFSKARLDGSDLLITNSNNKIIPMQIRYFDPIAKRALLWIRDPEPTMKINYGKQSPWPFTYESVIWEGISATLQKEFFHLHFENFETKNTINEFPNFLSQEEWYQDATTTANLLQPEKYTLFSLAIKADTTKRSLNALHIKYEMPANDSLAWVLVGNRFAKTPKDLRMLDSLVLWAKGDGLIRVALENTTTTPITKAWKIIYLQKDWTRYSITPNDFDPPGAGDNIGWKSVRDSITTLTIFGQYGSEFWIDDIDMYGIHPLELR